MRHMTPNDTAQRILGRCDNIYVEICSRCSTALNGELCSFECPYDNTPHTGAKHVVMYAPAAVITRTGDVHGRA